MSGDTGWVCGTADACGAGAGDTGNCGEGESEPYAERP